MLDLEARLVIPVLERMVSMRAVRYGFFHIVFVEYFHVILNEEVKEPFLTHAVDFASAAVLLIAQDAKVQTCLGENGCDALGYALNSWVISRCAANKIEHVCA